MCAPPLSSSPCTSAAPTTCPCRCCPSTPTSSPPGWARRVVLVCQSGARAEQARQRLAKSGIDTAYVLTGGVPGFAAAGGDVVKGKDRWDLERQVRLAAGSLVVLGLAGGKFVSPKIRMLAGAIGTGLTFSAATNTCAMGQALSAMPWNKAAKEPTRESAILQLPRAGS